MSPNPLAARSDAQTPTGCVVVVADILQYRLLLRLAGRTPERRPHPPRIGRHALGCVGEVLNTRDRARTGVRTATVTYVIAQPCVDVLDKACIEECPVDCIYEGARMLYIHPDECVDCGACEPVCPVEAIFYEDDTPEQWKDYYKANVEFFDDLGSPGGASKLGKIDKDHPIVEALPPQDH
jgi:NAD-dependent dihydropyrimidine dehydrogenase PreA subunit